MREIIVIASVSLIILLVLIQKISIRLKLDGEFSIELDYSFLCITLVDKGGGASFGKIKPDVILPIKRTAELLLCHSEIKISEIRLITSEDDPRKFGVRYRNLFSLFSAALVYLSKKAKKISLSDDAISISNDPENNKKHFIDVSIISPLYVALVSAATFFLILLKSKRKEKIKAR